MIAKNNCGDISSFSYDWSNVKHFFLWTDRIWGRKYFVDISGDEQISFTKVKTRKESYRRFIELWQEWSDKTTKEKDTMQFEYPVWNLIRNYNDLITSEVLVGIPLVFLFLLCAFTTKLRIINISPVLFIILVFILCIILLGLFCVKCQKRFYKISLINNMLKVNFVDGDIKELPLQDIKRYAFDINAFSSFIVFNNGIRLIHLERVSYWPILREYLLSKLEPTAG